LPVAWKMTSLTVFHNPLPPPSFFLFPSSRSRWRNRLEKERKLNKNILITWVSNKIGLSWFFWNTFFS
jgi:hypothetical protein